MAKLSKTQIKNIIIEHVKSVGEYPTSTECQEEYGITKSKVRCNFGSFDRLFNEVFDDVKEYLGEVSYFPHSRRQLNIRESGVYIISSHQNDTPYNVNFVNALMSLKKHLKAKLIIVPTYYQTRMAYKKEGGIDPRWSSDLQPYYKSEPIQLNDYLEICGGLNVASTAADPLSGFQSLTGKRSAIIAHPQIRWKYIATPPGDPAKALMTTGSVSRRNYTPTKAGAKGAFHHTSSALVVYVEGDYFWPFVVNADSSGGVYHHEFYYKPNGDVERADGKSYALTVGDIHAEWIDPKVVDATWTSKRSICNTLPIKIQVWHDIIDFNSVHSHHNKNNLIYNIALKKQGVGDVIWCLKTCGGVLEKLLQASPQCEKVYVVSSNHHDHFAKFLNTPDLKALSHEDLRIYFKTMLKITEDTYLDATNIQHASNALQLALEEFINADNYKKLVWLDDQKPCRINGIDNSQHGHKGPNGMRGTRAAFANTSTKMNIMHSHTPGIEFGVYQGGHSGYQQRNYNGGYSSWVHSHILTYPNGKRTLITIINGRWRP